MSTTSHDWTGRSKGTPLGYRIFILVMRLMGVRAAYALLYFVAPWYVLTSRSSNRALRAYFARVRSVNHEVRGLGLLASYLSFGRSIIDKIALQAGLSQGFTWTKQGREHIAALMAGGTGGILLSAHLGNWELASHVLKAMPGRMSVVLRDGEHTAIRQVLERAKTSSFNAIPLSNDLSHIIRMDQALREGQVLCMHADRRMPGARVRRASFLGAEADFPAGPFALAAARQVPVCIAFVVRTGPQHYHFTCTAPIPAGTTADVIFTHYLTELEGAVLAHPVQWFNYHDFWDRANTTGHR